MAKPRDHCGVVLCHTLHDTFKALKAIQHRGQDTAGIAGKTKYGIDILRWQGLVEDFSLDNIGKILNRGEMFIGHVRYATYGPKDMLFDGAHPRFLGGKATVDCRGSPHPHIIIRGATKAISHNGTLVGVSPDDGIDTDKMLRLYDEYGIEEVIEKLPAAYATVILDMQKDEGVVFRDRHEIRPLWIGKKDGRIVAASEDVAIWEIGGTPIREVRGGEVIYINHEDDTFRSEQIVKERDPKRCFFEYNYNASRSATLAGRAVSDIRYQLGVELGNEFRPENVDFVTYIPHSPEQMARGYSDTTGIEFKEVFYKVKMKRSFLGATPEERKLSIGENLFVLDNIDLRSKRIIIVDDSLVRSTNAKDAVKKLRERGVKWMGLALGTPPLGPLIDGEQHCCYYGVDMPEIDDFALRKYGSIEGIKEAIGVDELYYISMEGLEKAHSVPLTKLCTYCIGGPNPVSEKELEVVRALNL